MYISDTGNNRIRCINTTTGVIKTLAGNGFNNQSTSIIAVNHSLSGPREIDMDETNQLLFVSDSGNHMIKYINVKAGTIHAFAGTGIPGFSGDGGPALNASLNNPTGVAIDYVRDLIYISDSANHRVRVVNRKTGIIQTLAGTGEPGDFGDGSLASEAELNLPKDVVVDLQNDILFIIDAGNYKLRVVNRKTGIITTIAGTGNREYAGDKFAAILSSLYDPSGLDIDTITNIIYIAQPIRIQALGLIQCYKGSFGKFPCELCPLGTFNDAVGADSCKICARGTYTDTVGSVICKPCPSGLSSVNGTCFYCSPGFYSDRAGSVACYPCERGYFNSELGASNCLPCGAGFYSDNVGASQCLPCPAGSFSSLSNSTSCTPCPLHTASSVANATSSAYCKACPVGGFTANVGSTECDCQVYYLKTGKDQCIFHPAIPAVLVFGALLGCATAVLFGYIVYRVCKMCDKRRENSSIVSLLQDKNNSQTAMLLNSKLCVISYSDLQDIEELKVFSGSSALLLTAKWKNERVVIKLFKLVHSIVESSSSLSSASLSQRNEKTSASSSNQDKQQLLQQQEQHVIPDEILNEIQLMLSIKHPNIVSMYGVSLTPPRIGIVMEYCEFGSLSKYMAMNKGKVSWKKKICLLMDIAKGMQFLHGKNVIHRDLKSKCICNTRRF